MTIGTVGNATTIVSENNTAKAVGSGDLQVFSTPMMIALMEKAACDCFVDIQSENGQSSVGTQISVAHTCASALGANISATATITEIDGRRVSFAVVAHEGEKEIGKGTHERFIIDTARFMSKLQSTQ